MSGLHYLAYASTIGMVYVAAIAAFRHACRIAEDRED